jgi:hypothetical protein
MKNPGDTATIKMPNPTTAAQIAKRPLVRADLTVIGESKFFIAIICAANDPFSSLESAAAIKSPSEEYPWHPAQLL